MVMIYPHAKLQGHRSVGSEDRVIEWKQTDGQTEAIALPAAFMRSVTSAFNRLDQYASSRDHSTYCFAELPTYMQ